MKYPSPENPERAPVWDNYVVAQCTQAALGNIPRHALAVGVTVDQYDVTLLFQLTELTPEDVEDMEEIAGDLATLLGSDARVLHTWKVLQEPSLRSPKGVRWIYRAHW